MKKAKEKIRIQIIKSLEAYKGEKRFHFFETDQKQDNVKLDNDDLEVLLMKLDSSNWILLTTKCLFIRQNRSNIRVNVTEIEDFEFLNLKNYKNNPKEKASEFKKLIDFKSWLYSGDFRIIKKDETDVIVNLPHHDFGFCLYNAIKKLRFVTNKYEGF